MSSLRRVHTFDESTIRSQSKLVKFFSFRKELHSTCKLPKIRISIEKQRERLFTMNYQMLGNPENTYLIRKIKGYTSNVPNLRYKRMQTYQGNTKNLTKPLSFITSVNDQYCYTECCRSNRLQDEDKQEAMSKAYLMNECQKIERLMVRKQQQQEQYKSLSQRIQNKMSPKKLKVKIFDSPRPMDKSTWYKNWKSVEQNSSKWKKGKLLKRMKTFQTRNSLKSYILGENM